MQTKQESTAWKDEKPVDRYPVDERAIDTSTPKGGSGTEKGVVGQILRLAEVLFGSSVVDLGTKYLPCLLISPSRFKWLQADFKPSIHASNRKLDGCPE
jgi:hypothetical protein